MKVVVIGAVKSTFEVLQKLIQHQFEVVAVFGQEPKNITSISGFVNLKDICKNHHLNYIPFQQINDPYNIDLLKSLHPDIIFAVGFSQLVSEEILSIPSLGCIGFHPTALPKGRGRAPLSWLILNESQGAATFFLMTTAVDNGPIFIQDFFEVTDKDTANTVEEKVILSIRSALDRWLPELKLGNWDPIHQQEREATYYEKRTPQDGWINWNNGADDIETLIRATTKPYPGAYTFFKTFKVIVWAARVEENIKITGVIGRVLLSKNNELLIQTGKGLIWLEDFEFEDYSGSRTLAFPLKVGDKFGYNLEFELFKIKNLLNL